MQVRVLPNYQRSQFYSNSDGHLQLMKPISGSQGFRRKQFDGLVSNCIRFVCAVRFSARERGNDNIVFSRISAGSAFYYNYDLEGTSSTTNNTCLDIQQYPNEGWSWQVQNLFFLINIKQAEVMK